METHARYVLIGGFTLAGFLGILGFILWFTSVGVDRQFAYYDIDFDSVSGLNNASAVRFNGFPVGQVVSMGLAPGLSGAIRVRIEVDSETPVRTGTTATVESQGVTGVGFVALTAGEPDEPLLRDVVSREVPMIAGERSTLQVLTEDAPEIVEEALAVARQIREVLGEENQAHISSIFENLDASSADLSQALEDFSSVTGTIATASEEMAAFSGRLEVISNAATQVLETADVTLQQVGALAEGATTTLEIGNGALETGRGALRTADSFLTEDLPAVITDLSETTAHIREQVSLLVDDSREMVQEFQAAGALASARLTEAETTLGATDAMLAQLTQTLASVDEASQSIQGLVEGDGAALVDDLRTAVADANSLIASATTMATDDLPAIFADIRTATATAAETVESVGADLTAAVGGLEGLPEQVSAALTTATQTFDQAKITLDQLNGAIETGNQALAAAESAFVQADTVIREDVTAIAGDLRQSLGQLDTALAAVTEDLPEITGNLRETAERANAAIAQFHGAVSSASGPVRQFSADGLPQYTRLATETRELVATLEQLIRNIERDPTRYFLGEDEPVFRR